MFNKKNLSALLVFATVQTFALYRNNLKSRDFVKEAHQNLDSERATIAERQGASENQNYDEKPTSPKTDSSGCFGIEPLSEEASRALLGIITSQSHSSHAKQAAFETLRSSSPRTEPHYIPYCNPEDIEVVREVPSNTYAEIVKSMTISCVDAFVYNFENNSYLMIHRTTPPANGKWWIPGGRIFKGESFYESAVRKTKKESGLDICPVAQLGTYSTYFSESAWGPNVHTDTKNTVVLALCDNQNPLFDEHHQGFKWVSIDEAPTDPYILAAYKEARAKLTDLGFIR